MPCFQLSAIPKEVVSNKEVHSILLNVFESNYSVFSTKSKTYELSNLNYITQKLKEIIY